MSKTAEWATDDFPDPEAATNVTHNPHFEELRSLSAALETETEYGSPSYVSEKKSRTASRTKNTVDDEFDASDRDHVRRAQETLREEELVCVDRQMGRRSDTSYVCRLYVPEKYARIALAWAKLFEPAPEGSDPDFQTVQLPEWSETRIRVFVEDGVTYVLGSDYTGEAKKSFLRLFMRDAKEEGGLGLHAGTKRMQVRDADGDLTEVGQAFLGLSATGKSTLTSHSCWLEDPEEAAMIQDDVCALLPDGTVAGSEGNGLYVKTDGLTESEQPNIYRAVTQSHAVLENVRVDADGTVDFDDTSLTANGRAVILREDLPSASDNIDLSNVDQTFFITRNPVMPPIARLTPEQATVAFMLGESVQTSAGDPSRAGESIRVVGTNPFIVGSPGAEGNRFYDLVTENDIECFVMNTGYVGDGGPSVGVEESVTILTEAARGTITWRRDERYGLELPESVPGIDISEFYPPDHADDFEGDLSALRTERRTYLDQFEDLRSDVRQAQY